MVTKYHSSKEKFEFEILFIFYFLGNNIKLIARTEHDAVVGTSEKDLSFMNIKALNEWDSRYSGNIDWRQKLDVQRGAVLANELKHNSCKLSR